MSSRDDPTPGPTEALRLEAAEWFARMRREDSERFRPEFEAWLASPEHRTAYNRLAARFSDAKILHHSIAISDTLTRRPRPHRRIGTAALLVATLALFALTFMFVVRPGQQSAGTIVQTAQLEGREGAITRFRLRDGSVVTLDRGAMVSVLLNAKERNLRLERGRARFAVAHERRPFTVNAGSGRVIARGTIFDVVFAGGRTDVALIEGAIDVTLKSAGNAKAKRLRAGQSVELDRGHINERPAFAPPAAPDWPRAMAEIHSETLDSLLARANRLSVIQLEAVDPNLAATRLSGHFRLDDPTHLAANLARLLDLELSRQDTRIILSPRDRQKISSTP